MGVRITADRVDPTAFAPRPQTAGEEEDGARPGTGIQGANAPGEDQGVTGPAGVREADEAEETNAAEEENDARSEDTAAAQIQVQQSAGPANPSGPAVPGGNLDLLA